MGARIPNEPAITAVERAGLTSATDTVAAAFMADPFFVYLIGNDSHRQKWLTKFMNAALKRSWPNVYGMETPEGQYRGVLSVFPPGHYPPSNRRTLEFMVRLFRTLPGLARYSSRMLRGYRVLRQLDYHHVTESHWYIQDIAIHPDMQGMGLGRNLMEWVLERADRENVPTFLETSNPINIGFYRRFGFEVDKTIESVGGPPPVWTMLRPSQRQV